MWDSRDESVYSMYVSKNGILWLTLDNGISKVDISSPFSRFGLQSGINTSVPSLSRYNGTMYIGSSNGLLKYDPGRKHFDKVEGFNGYQIFSLSQDGGTMLIPQDGLFAIYKDKLIAISKSVSANMSFFNVFVSRLHPNLMLAGGGQGIGLYERKAGIAEWGFKGFIPGITEGGLDLSEEADGTIWVVLNPKWYTGYPSISMDKPSRPQSYNSRETGTRTGDCCGQVALLQISMARLISRVTLPFIPMIVRQGDLRSTVHSGVFRKGREGRLSLCR